MKMDEIQESSWSPEKTATDSRLFLNTQEVEMNKIISDLYKGWLISITAEDNQCSAFSFDITSPSKQTQHVAMGGITQQRALERAREMIDMEISFAEED